MFQTAPSTSQQVVSIPWEPVILHSPNPAPPAPLSGKPLLIPPQLGPWGLLPRGYESHWGSAKSKVFANLTLF